MKLQCIFSLNSIAENHCFFCQVNQLTYNHQKIANYISTCQIANRKYCVLLIHAESSAIMVSEWHPDPSLCDRVLSVDWLGSLLQCQREIFAKCIVHPMKIVSMTGSKKLFSALLNNSNDLWFIICAHSTNERDLCEDHSDSVCNKGEHIGSISN